MSYVKALSVQNVAQMVYAQQVFHEPGMLPGFHMCRLYDGIECIPDGGWIVWYDCNGPYYDTLADEEFRDVFVLYGEMPDAQKRICDAHPDYDEWLKIMDARFPDTRDNRQEE